MRATIEDGGVRHEINSTHPKRVSQSAVTADLAKSLAELAQQFSGTQVRYAIAVAPIDNDI